MHYQMDIEMDRYVMMIMMMTMMMMVMVVMTMITMMMMIDMYVDKQQMSLYHGSIIVSCVSYSENTFSHRLISFLDSLSCPVDDDAS